MTSVSNSSFVFALWSPNIRDVFDMLFQFKNCTSTLKECWGPLLLIILMENFSYVDVPNFIKYTGNSCYENLVCIDITLVANSDSLGSE